MTSASLMSNSRLLNISKVAENMTVMEIVSEHYRIMLPFFPLYALGTTL